MLNLLEGKTGLQEEVRALVIGRQDRLFADLRGTLSQARPNETGQFALTRVYRLQREGHGCGEENFKHLILRASGHEPGWSVNVTSRGMLLTRPGSHRLPCLIWRSNCPAVNSVSPARPMHSSWISGSHRSAASTAPAGPSAI